MSEMSRSLLICAHRLQPIQSDVGKVSKSAQTMIATTFTVWGMDSELSDSLEALVDLLNLIRKSLHNPAAISAYVALAEGRIRAITIQRAAISLH
jgi:hypothetical protein